MRTIFESFVRNLKKHPLLGVDCIRFFCWNRKELVSICEYVSNINFGMILVFLLERQMR